MIMELYRYETVYADEWTSNYIELREFNVVKETEYYYYIEVRGKQKKCKKNAISSYAYDNKQSAINNYRHRTKRYHLILQESLKNVSKTLSMLDDISDKDLLGFNINNGYFKCKDILGTMPKYRKDFFDYGDYMEQQS